MYLNRVGIEYKFSNVILDYIALTLLFRSFIYRLHQRYGMGYLRIRHVFSAAQLKLVKRKSIEPYSL